MREAELKGIKYERVFPGDGVLFEGKHWTVSSAHWMDNDGMQVASIVLPYVKNSYRKVRADKLQILTENDKQICEQMASYWDHLEGKEFENKMIELGILP